MDREARGDEDRGVDTGDELRQLERLERPLGLAVHAHEEVRGEERAEQHHLGGDEEEHAENGRLDTRAPVGLGRMGRVRVVRGFSVGRHGWTGSAPTASAAITTCSTGTPASLWS